MPFFQYKARGNDGKTVTGLVEAPNESVAARLLHEKQLFVTSLQQSSEKYNLSAILQRFQRVGFTDTVNFTRELATMVVAGLSLPEALTILRAQTTNKLFAAMLQDVDLLLMLSPNILIIFPLRI
jgi:type IV pilus assembly protein PilC